MSGLSMSLKKHTLNVSKLLVTIHCITHTTVTKRARHVKPRYMRKSPQYLGPWGSIKLGNN